MSSNESKCRFLREFPFSYKETFDVSFSRCLDSWTSHLSTCLCCRIVSGGFSQEIETNGTTLHVRVGGHGPAVVMLHGFGDTGDMWAPVAAVLAKDHTVVVPDLRGMGLSLHPDTGYTKKNEAVDIAGVMDHLKIEKADLVTHDIGNMVGYALAARSRIPPSVEKPCPKARI
jgi:cephalosporin-C deacetylase-like acetyl esterase